MVNLEDKRREWLENLRALKRKKQEELEELEDKKKKELEEAEEMLKAGVEDLSAEEEETLQRLREAIPELADIEKAKEEEKEEEKQEESLEETIAGEKISEEAMQRAGPTYEPPTEETITAVYQTSDYNVYNELKETFEKVQRGDYLTNAEKREFHKRQEQFNQLHADKNLIEDKDNFGYIERSKQIINAIDETLHSQAEYKTGDDHI